MEAAPIGDIFVTRNRRHQRNGYAPLRGNEAGAMVANSGHFNVEINLKGLAEMADGEPHSGASLCGRIQRVKGKAIYVLGEGRLINLAAAEGHPASVMDMSFANQALGAEYMVKNAANMEPNVYVIPEEVDNEIARIKLEAMGISIDTLTEEQVRYLNQWEEGT
jgi:adenosylhomocysteinase